MRQTFLDGGKLVMLLKKFLAKSRETLSHIMSKILAFPPCDAPDLCKSEQDWGVLKNPQRYNLRLT